MSPGSRNRDIGPEADLLAKKENLRQRARILGAVRGFFLDHGYLEVETPYIVETPIPEAHIEYVETPRGVLHPSPEIYMKRLLSAGYDRIFQIARCFREGERGDRHIREFTLLEWYRTGIGYLELMDECEFMIRSVAKKLGLGRTLPRGGRALSLESPWERIPVTEAFERYSPMPAAEALERDRFDEMLGIHVEPCLGTDAPAFIYDYPASRASLSRLRAGDPSLCERFELYMGGLEIANGFSELTDPGEQRERFLRETDIRRASGLKVFPLPESFLRALENMPRSAGIALGLDRLVMVFRDCARIDDVVAFTPEDG